LGERKRESHALSSPFEEYNLAREEDAERGTHVSMSSGRREFNDESHELSLECEGLASSARHHFYVGESVRRKAARDRKRAFGYFSEAEKRDPSHSVP